MVGKVIIARGFQENRGAWRINEAVGYEPKTVEQLAKEGKVKKPRAKKHCDFWIKEGKFYGKTKDGRYYRLPFGPQPGER
jgi:hypothetical protein